MKDLYSFAQPRNDMLCQYQFESFIFLISGHTQIKSIVATVIFLGTSILTKYYSLKIEQNGLNCICTKRRNTSMLKTKPFYLNFSRIKRQLCDVIDIWG